MVIRSQEKAGSDGAVNEVRLVGRVSNDPERRELPSGDALVSFRLVVQRPAAAYRGTQRVDVLDCVVTAGRAMRTVAAWRAGAVVEVSGSVRRRFFQTASGAASRVEIEVHSAKVIRRAASA